MERIYVSQIIRADADAVWAVVRAFNRLPDWHRPAACLSTVRNRMARVQKRLGKVRNSEQQTTIVEDLDTLAGLETALKAITPARFRKYQLLREQLAGGAMQWSPKDAEDRLVTFTESIVTLEFLQQHLPRDLGLKKARVAVLRGDMRDRDLMETVDAFNRRESSIRLLLCSDVAAEGINLHHLSHRLIHFDIPWSLMVFQQRNGRIDRYGQTRAPQIRYLLTESANQRVRGDQRVLEVLIEKDAQAGKNIGDPSEFMGLYDPQAEEDKVAQVIEGSDGSGNIWQQFEALMDSQLSASESPLDNFVPATDRVDRAHAISPLSGIFDDGIEYARAALRWLTETGETLDAGIEDQTFWIHAPADLKPRLNRLPREARPDNDHFTLTPDVQAINRDLQRTRQQEDTGWPTLHYLWPLHPVMEWLSDRALNAFGRHTAPVLRLPNKLGNDEHIGLIHGGFPNRRGHILVQDWVGVRMSGTEVLEQMDWDMLQDRLDLRPGQLPNPGMGGDTSSLRRLLPAAVAAATTRLQALKTTTQTEREPQLVAQRRRLGELKARHETQLELALARSQQADSIKSRRRDERQSHIDRIFRDYQDWLDNTQTTEEEPYLQVIAVFTGHSAKGGC